MDSIFGIGLGLIAVAFVSMNINKKDNKVSNKVDKDHIVQDHSVGDPSFGANSLSNNDVKSNINYHIKYIKYKNKYLKEKRNMKGGAFTPPSTPVKIQQNVIAGSADRDAMHLLSLSNSSMKKYIFINGESVEEFIQELIKIHKLVTSNIIYPICITGSSAIAILLYHLNLDKELATMNKPSDFDFLFENKNGIGIGNKLNQNFLTLSRKKDINGNMIGNAESSTWESTESPYTFDLTGIPSDLFSKYFSLVLFNFNFNIVSLKSLISSYKDDISTLEDNIKANTSIKSIKEKLNRKIERLKLLNIILETIEKKNIEEEYGLSNRKKVSPDNRFNFASSESPGSPDNRFNFASSESPLTPVKRSANQQNFTPIKKGNLFDE